MLYDRHLLKSKLTSIKNNDFHVPDDLNIYELALAMMKNIGDPDPELRDSLIYDILSEWIAEEVFTVEETKNLLDISLDDEHLFYKLGEKDTDSVLTRSFSALIVAVILYIHRNKSFLQKEDLKKIVDKITVYMQREVDVRGFIDDKGWAHSAAHGADVINELAQCSEVTPADLLKLLQIIKEKVCINGYCYVCKEDERLAKPVINIIERKLLENTDIKDWITTFSNINRRVEVPQDIFLGVNVKNFLRSVHYRLLGVAGADEIVEALRKAIDVIQPW